ncbi:hypothetical protein ABZ650_20585 [Streptomyces griseoviridis]|uniref:hypothetical protein n=1 Tax=Streptomyces griseoviridis TaxID=45398 RepID=UPI00340D1634
MATWQCAECTAVYSVGALKCPECGSTVRVNDATQPREEEQDMAKVTVHGGPSIEGFHVDPETSEVTPIETEVGEDVSAGSSFSTSPEKDDGSQKTSEQQNPKPARSAGSRSAKAGTGRGSSAGGTDGGPADGGSETGSDDA